MHILIINKFLYPKGGAEVSALSTGKLLEAKGHRVHFWGMAHPENASFSRQETFVPHVDLNNGGNFFRQLKTAANLFYSFEAKHRLEAFLEKERPDIVHLHNFAHQISPSILDVLKNHRIPCVMTLHDYKLVCASYQLLSHGKICERCAGGRHYHCFLQGCVKDAWIKSLLNTAEMYLHHSVLRIYDSISCFIAPSLFLKQKMEAMGFRKKLTHLANFVDSANFRPAYDWKETAIAYVGRLAREKGVNTLIEAARQMPNIDIKLIGDGPDRARLEQIARVKNARNIHFLGRRSAEALHAEIKRAMCVVAPSAWYENNPLAIIEAFALGKAVVGARIGGIPELVKDHQTGITFTSGDADDLAEKIHYAVRDGARLKRWGRMARSFVETELNAEKHYTNLMSIYEEALAT